MGLSADVRAGRYVRNEAGINLNCCAGSPDPGVPADNFSIRWHRYAWFHVGTYRFTLFADDGVRL
jgi:hypothetical protein